MKRRAALSVLAAPVLAGFRMRSALAASAPAMKITRIDTTWWKTRDDAPFWPHWTWVRLHTDTGLVGLGETYPRNEVEAAMVHAGAARMLLGKDPRDIDRHWADLYQAFDYQIAGGTEMRVLSALDLALWDLLGKSLESPVYRLIGGRSNPRVRLYNTCFPHRYDFNLEPERIMKEVLEGYGIKAIKVWPFDKAAERNGRQFVTPADIEEGLRPVRRLRDAFGDAIDILVEFHSNWNLAAAVRIAQALEPLRPMWLEDMLQAGHFADYRRLAEATPLALTVGERMAGRYQFQELLDQKAARYVMFDVCWCGGLSEAQRIAAMAAANHLSVAPHTAGGPLLFYASTHLTTALTNVAIQESCQRFYESDWPKMLEDPLVPKEGSVAAPDAPGFGMRVKPEVWSHAAAITRTSTL